ncbi:phosphoribosyltransferase domain-containing protein [Photobacterium leiognathi]|uniref:phosphoribosyltransferase domain-containing protein n=1 Tax=Photobacterium leiognathi TaxID=553611 RepID=UPI001EDD7C04|nr:phosphoribosyltransferase domain-containing protein [Photobacterium leiognathi]MCG3884460.1 phosphoribosyltransferase domain-containing protein [Photobacterium leiognathi]
MSEFNQKLTTGTISIKIDDGEWKMSDLFSLAERRNPKRSFLFVSKILGKHIPVAPSVMRQSYRDLAKKISPLDQDGVLFIGMAETAVGLAAGVYEEASKNLTNSMLLTTTRHPVDGKLLGEFKEEHSHATDHLIYSSVNNTKNNEPFSTYKTLVLVDDESTTGKTFINLINSLFNNNIIYKNNIKEIIAVTITDWSRNRFQELNETGIEIKTVSLMTGDWEWKANPDARLPTMPNVNVSAMGDAKVSPKQDWGRLGLQKYNNTKWLEKFNAQHGENILVLGTGEFLFPAFKAAEKMECQGANVQFSSTTRSPISNGLAIESSIAFTDNYGLGIPNYCYNVSHKNYDRIIICTETEPSFIDVQLIDTLEKISNKVEIAYYD